MTLCKGLPSVSKCRDCTWYQLLKWNDCKYKVPSCEFKDGKPEKLINLKSCPKLP